MKGLFDAWAGLARQLAEARGMTPRELVDEAVFGTFALAVLLANAAALIAMVPR